MSYSGFITAALVIIFFALLKIYSLHKSIRENDAMIKKLRTINNNLNNELHDCKEELHKHNQSLETLLKSNLEAFPYLAGMIADYITIDFEILAKQLDWGSSVERKKKIASIREIRSEAKSRIEESKIALYQLEYLKKLYPLIDDILDMDFREISNFKSLTDIEENYDPIRKYISDDEWKKLSQIEKNQLALENYIKSRKKSNWQIGRDYELFVGYTMESKGYLIDYYGSINGLEDMGRDLIVKSKSNKKIEIIQCKYWSKKKTIHEKHIFQLFGTMIGYGIENNISKRNLKGTFITNIDFSPKAVLVAEELGINLINNFEMNEFPRIKCNIGKDLNGKETKIYHLPMDQQYDKVKIDKPGEFYAFTVYEAETNGFRRAFKWHGN